MNDQFAQRARDLSILKGLYEVDIPTSYDKVLLGALMMRYQQESSFFKSVKELLSSWGTTPRDLFLDCRNIWANGFRPTELKEIGSSWDSGSEEQLVNTEQEI